MSTSALKAPSGPSAILERSSPIWEYEARLPRIVWGDGCTQRLEEEMRAMGLKRALVFSGRSIAKTSWLAALRQRLGERCVGVFAKIEPHTPIESVDGALAMARETAADCIVMIGGGSIQDAGKLVALLLAEGGDLDSCRVRWTIDRRLEIPSMRRAKLPLIAVPTTLSAAEVVGAATYVQGDKRYVIVDKGIQPRLVMYDPDIASTTPVNLFLGTGMNAVAHCVEAVYSVKSQPFSDALALGALRLLVKSLIACAADPGHKAAREQAMVGAAMSGIAYSNTWLGIAHSLCQALGARYRTAQGLLHAVVLPHAVKFNLPATAVPERQLRHAIADGFGTGISGEEHDASVLLQQLRDRLSLPRRLRDIGIPLEGLAEVAEDAFSIWHTFFNPRRVESPQELLEVMTQAW